MHHNLRWSCFLLLGAKGSTKDLAAARQALTALALKWFLITLWAVKRLQTVMSLDFERKEIKALLGCSLKPVSFYIN